MRTLKGTKTDYVHGAELAGEVYGLLFVGIQDGFINGKLVYEPRFCFTLDFGRGTTIMLTLRCSKEDILRKIKAFEEKRARARRTGEDRRTHGDRRVS